MDNAGVVKFDLGGVKRTVRVELALVPKIEGATGKGIFAIVREVMNVTAPTGLVCEVLREALAANGMNYDAQQVFEMLEHDGVMQGYKAAALVLSELVKGPSKTSGKKNASGAAPSTPATPINSH